MIAHGFCCNPPAMHHLSWPSWLGPAGVEPTEGDLFLFSSKLSLLRMPLGFLLSLQTMAGAEKAMVFIDCLQKVNLLPMVFVHIPGPKTIK